MICNSLLRIFASLFICGSALAASQPEPSVNWVRSEEDLHSLLEKMTLEEKVGQLVQYNGGMDLTGPPPPPGKDLRRRERVEAGMIGSFLNLPKPQDSLNAQRHQVEETRLGIPLVFGYDVIHGFRVSMPVPLAEAASFNLDLIEESARQGAIDAARAGVHWTFAPMVDVSRDPRWGRVMEGAGEDTWWGSQVGVARVKGFQGDDLSRNDTLAACAKHFAAYAFPEGGRDYNHAEISAWRLHNDVLPPFKAAADAGVATFMNSFNSILGVPATGSVYLQRDILRGDWGYDGMMVSDWCSIGEMVPHGFARDSRHAAELAIIAGSEMDMESDAYADHLADLVRDGVVDESLVDEAVLHVLQLKFNLGLFEDPYRYHHLVDSEDTAWVSEAEEVSLAMARESIVLLKNTNGVLPLSADLKKVALIGPLAKDADAPLGNWRAEVESRSAVTLYDGLREALPESTELLYHPGCRLVDQGAEEMFDPVVINETDRTGIDEAVAVAAEADVIVLAVGEVARMSGENRSMSQISLPGVQSELLAALATTGKPLVVVLFNGRPLVIPDVEAHADAIVEGWLLGGQSGTALAEVLVGEVNPSGKLPMSFPINEGQIPVYYAYFNTGRPTGGEGETSSYRDVPSAPLFSFGYGLSYSEFEYGPVELNSEHVALGEPLVASVEVSNTSSLDGAEVVQLYIRDVQGSAVRPMRELKGVRKLTIPAGESRTVSFDIDPEMLGFVGPDLKWKLEAGEFQVFIGGNSLANNRATFWYED